MVSFQSEDKYGSRNVNGYLHSRYAEALAEFGTPRELPRSQGWILECLIPGFPYYDARGCYPLFACQDWSQLHVDLENIGNELVSLALVADPFGEYDQAYLHQCFQDVVFPYKEHYVIDLERPMSSFVSKHHARNSRKAFQNVEVERCENPAQFANDWVNLYANLVRRHNIKAMSAFSRESLVKQLHVPGIVMFRAVHRQTTVGMIIWYVQGEVGYYHLAAYSDQGYKLRASFALFWRVIEYFATRLRWLNLGAGAGIRSDGKDGLTRFKSGWATGTQTAYFCGRIFDHARYTEIAKAKGVSGNDYFPIYRKGEFR
jgi:hypothetical protein